MTNPNVTGFHSNIHTTSNYGWICPKCGKVYSPMYPECYNCNSKEEEVIRDERK